MTPRTRNPASTMAKRCPDCDSIYGDSLDECPEDQAPLEAFDASDDELIGVIIDGRFRLESLLGAGGMGRVYRGKQLSVERDVAVKLLRGEAVPDQNLQERFFREARVISGFSHPNIIRLIDFGRDEDLDLPYLVMEMAGGVSLADLTEAGRLHPAFAVEVARQVCSGLLEAHNNGIVHRDLKPDNLHLIGKSDGSFLVKILDFGIARPEETDKNLTATGMMCGTAPYVSPEQARSDDLDGQTDLYALGVILFEMLTGIRPFQGDSGFEIIMQQVQEPPPQLTQYVPPGSIPEALTELVYDLLEKDARQRPPGAAAARDRLEDISGMFTADLTLDPGRSGVEQFEHWLLPTGPEDAPIAQADTAAGVENSDADPEATTDARESGASPRSGYTEVADSADRTGEGGGRAARSNPTSTGQTDSTANSFGIRTLLIAAAGLAGVALMLSLGYAAVRYLGTDASSTGDDESPQARAEGTTRTDTGSENELEPVSGSLDDFAGRCVAVGSSDAAFHTLYFYPDVGELLRRSSDGVRWSGLEIAGQRGDDIHFDYGKPGQQNEHALRGRVRKSGDKRIFQFEKAPEFVCHRESYRSYYKDLDLDGTWNASEGGDAIDFPAGGQSWTVVADDGADAGDTRTTVEYRLLEGTPGDDDILVAAHPESGGDWEVRRLERGDDAATLEVTTGVGTDAEETTVYEREGVDAQASAEEQTNDGAGSNRRTGSAGAAAGSGGSGDRGGTTTNSAEGGAQPSYGGSGSGGGGDEAGSMRDAWKHRFQKIMEQCRSAQRTMKQNNQKYSRLVNEGKQDQAEAFREKMKVQNQEASEDMREAAKDMSSLSQEMMSNGAPSSKVQKWYAKFSSACQGK